MTTTTMLKRAERELNALADACFSFSAAMGDVTDDFGPQWREGCRNAARAVSRCAYRLVTLEGRPLTGASEFTKEWNILLQSLLEALDTLDGGNLIAGMSQLERLGSLSPLVSTAAKRIRIKGV